ncbi:MAG: hypothetical protein LBR31_01220 [Desulfovibrio sp.]|jgi:hypothetical protein|nr:hypothetical protein [Desulfovibrio sp.]
MHFSLVKINPENAHHSHGFDDVILPLYFALRRLGFAVEVRFNSVNSHSRNIVFGSCIAPRRTGRMLPASSIIFNLEQIVAGNAWANPDYLTHLRCFEVWDYSLANADALKSAGVAQAVYVPLGYVPEMTRIAAHGRPDFDALFYGRISDRRHAVIQHLLSRGVNVLCPREAFGDLRDRLLARAGLVLNIHNIVPARLEVVRLGYVWANRKAVLSELGQGDEIPEDLRKACAFASREDMADAATRLLADAAALARQAETGFRAFAARSFPRTLEKLVGRRIHAVSGTTGGATARPAEWLVLGDI